jgi:hypothetical protein
MEIFGRAAESAALYLMPRVNATFRVILPWFGRANFSQDCEKNYSGGATGCQVPFFTSATFTSAIFASETNRAPGGVCINIFIKIDA